MLAPLLLAHLFLQTALPSAQPAAPRSAQSAAAPAQTKPAPSKDEDSDPTALLKVKRIFVENFGEDIISKEMQSMIVSSLVSSKRFKVTENRDHADAILKGAALEKSSQELHAYGESTTVGGASGGSHAQVSGSGGNISGSSNGGFVARHLGTSDSSANTETIDSARVAIRLVNPDGDVIWTTTQESKGAKYKGASADVADKCVKQLLHDVAKLEGSGDPSPAPASSPKDTPH
jgi:curli biogenesis system outer membrane secretion channel CsgG